MPLFGSSMIAEAPAPVDQQSILRPESLWRSCILRIQRQFRGELRKWPKLHRPDWSLAGAT